MQYLRLQLRRKSVAYCFTNLAGEHYLRELAELLKVDPANLSRELRTLERERLFASRTRGRQKYFRLKRRYPLYEEMRRSVFKTIGVAGQLRDVLSSTSGITEAYLYDSFAENREGAASDGRRAHH